MYRNYDGNKSTFGDMSVAAVGPNPDNVSAFAAQRTSDGALTALLSFFAVALLTLIVLTVLDAPFRFSRSRPG